MGDREGGWKRETGSCNIINYLSTQENWRNREEEGESTDGMRETWDVGDRG